MVRWNTLADGRMRANTPRHSRDPAQACLEERPFVRLDVFFSCLDSNPHSSVDFPAKENRKPSVTAPEVSPPRATLAGQQENGWTLRGGAQSLVTCSLLAWRFEMRWTRILQVIEMRAQKKIARP
jgi:hypothetical protein